MLSACTRLHSYQQLPQSSVCPQPAVMTATTIVSGCLAERAQFEAYLAYSPLMAVLVYPLVVHWVTEGWLTTFATHCTYLDFAGGSMVHLVGEPSVVLLSCIFQRSYLPGFCGKQHGAFCNGECFEVHLSWFF